MGEHTESKTDEPRPYFTNEWIQACCVEIPHTVETLNIRVQHHACHRGMQYRAGCPEGQKKHLLVMLRSVTFEFLDQLRRDVCRRIKRTEVCDSTTFEETETYQQLCNVREEVLALRDQKSLAIKKITESIRITICKHQESGK